MFFNLLARLAAIDWFPIRLSFQVAGLATIIALIVGLCFAYLLARRRVPARELLDALLTLPLVLPPTVLGYFGVTIMIAGNIPHKTQTAAIAIYDAVQAGRDNEALALVVVISIICVIVLYITNHIGRGRL